MYTWGRIPAAWTTPAVGDLCFASKSLEVRAEECAHAHILTLLNANSTFEVLELGSCASCKVRCSSACVGWITFRTEDGEMVISRSVPSPLTRLKRASFFPRCSSAFRTIASGSASVKSRTASEELSVGDNLATLAAITLRQEAPITSDVLDVLPSGCLIEILELDPANQHRCKVKLDTNVVGWISTRSGVDEHGPPHVAKRSQTGERWLFRPVKRAVRNLEAVPEEQPMIHRRTGTMTDNSATGGLALIREDDPRKETGEAESCASICSTVSTTACTSASTAVSRRASLRFPKTRRSSGFISYLRAPFKSSASASLERRFYISDVCEVMYLVTMRATQSLDSVVLQELVAGCLFEILAFLPNSTRRCCVRADSGIVGWINLWSNDNKLLVRKKPPVPKQDLVDTLVVGGTYVMLERGLLWTREDTDGPVANDLRSGTLLQIIEKGTTDRCRANVVAETGDRGWINLVGAQGELLIGATTKTMTLVHPVLEPKPLKSICDSSEAGDVASLKRAMEILDVPSDTVKLVDGRTPLMLAAGNGHVDTVRYLLKVVCMDPNVTDLNGRSALGHALCMVCTNEAAEARRSEVMQLLVNGGANVAFHGKASDVVPQGGVDAPKVDDDAVIRTQDASEAPRDGDEAAPYPVETAPRSFEAAQCSVEATPSPSRAAPSADEVDSSPGEAARPTASASQQTHSKAQRQRKAPKKSGTLASKKKA